MDELASLKHSKWECKYHVVFIPKCRRKTLYMQLRQYLGEVFRKRGITVGVLVDHAGRNRPLTWWSSG